eukprot:222346-Chlamydomonas_euryale.AAC.1
MGALSERKALHGRPTRTEDFAWAPYLNRRPGFDAMRAAVGRRRRGAERGVRCGVGQPSILRARHADRGGGGPAAAAYELGGGSGRRAGRRGGRCGGGVAAGVVLWGGAGKGAWVGGVAAGVVLWGGAGNGVWGGSVVAGVVLWGGAGKGAWGGVLQLVSPPLTIPGSAAAPASGAAQMDRRATVAACLHGSTTSARLCDTSDELGLVNSTQTHTCPSLSSMAADQRARFRLHAYHVCDAGRGGSASTPGLLPEPLLTP